MNRSHLLSPWGSFALAGSAVVAVFLVRHFMYGPAPDEFFVNARWAEIMKRQHYVPVHNKLAVKVAAVLEGHTDEATDVAVPPNGLTLVFGDNRHSLQCSA